MNKTEVILAENRKGYELKLDTHNRLYGPNTAFLVSEHYQSHYHDDYASFTYYSNITGEYFSDTWATAFGCPCYSEYLTKKFEEALTEGLIDIDTYNKAVVIPEVLFEDDINLYAYALRCKHAPFVEVTGGRKKPGKRGLAFDSYNHPYGGEYYLIYFPDEDDFASISRDHLKVPADIIEAANELWRVAREKEMAVNDRLRSLDPAEVVKPMYPDDYENHILTLRNRWNDIRNGITPKLIQWVEEHFTEVKDPVEIRRIAGRIAAKKRNKF